MGNMRGFAQVLWQAPAKSQGNEIVQGQHWSNRCHIVMKGSVHCSAALPHPMNYPSVKMKRQGVGLEVLWRQIAC